MNCCKGSACSTRTAAAFNRCFAGVAWAFSNPKFGARRLKDDLCDVLVAQLGDEGLIRGLSA